MKQFRKILEFELKNYFTNKIFVGVTVFLMILIAAVMFFPRIINNAKDTEHDPSDLPLMLIASDGEDTFLAEAFSAAFTGYRVEIVSESLDTIQDKIVTGEAECAFVLKSPTEYTYYVKNLSLYDGNEGMADAVLAGIYQMTAMADAGLTEEEIQKAMHAEIVHTTENLGVNQQQNFLYTYVMIMALYMVILLYGQMVATNVATEKSSRAMELLITSADPVSMMFGKVLSSCIAGLTQLIAIFGTSLILYRLNASYWDEASVISSIFDMPADLFGYMLVFFIFGFLVYAFMYGAVGSTASKLEDINTSVMPITLLFIAGFIVVIISMSEGNVDTVLLKICSYIPFTAPMAMFTRIAMSTVPLYEILTSVCILIASASFIGYISAKIYRLGVLLYGTPPKPAALLNMLRKK